MNNRRHAYWDCVKGVCIVAVILIHTTAIDSVAGTVWRQFINFPVFLFFVLAGYFCKYEGGYVQFIKKKVVRLMPPFLFFSVLYAILDLRAAVRHGCSVGGKDIVDALIAFGRGWGYFVVALAQCYMVVPVLVGMRISVRLALATVCYFASAAVMYALILENPTVKGVDGPIPFIFVTTWILPFTMGISLRESDYLVQKIRHWSAMRVAVSLGGLLMLSILEGIVYFNSGYRVIGISQIKLSSVVLSIMLTLALFAKQVEVGAGRCRWLTIMGEASFFIYLSHRIFILGGKSLLVRMHLELLPSAVFMFLVVMGVIIGELVSSWLLLRWNPKWLSYLGFSR